MTPAYHQTNITNNNNTLNGTSSSRKHFNPYQRSITTKHYHQQQQTDLNLQQVELGIVDGSSLNPFKPNNSSKTSHHPPPTTETAQKTGLLTKCVDWLFKLPIQPKLKKKPTSSNQQHSNSLANQPSDPSPKPNTSSNQITHIDFKQLGNPLDHRTNNPPKPTNPHPSVTINHANFNSLPNHNRSRSIDKMNLLRSQSPFVSNHPPILNSSSPSSTLRSTRNNLSIHPPQPLDQKKEPRRPSTSHATLQIPISSIDSNSIFNPHVNRLSHSKYQRANNLGGPSVRSLSPLSRWTTFSPSAQIIQSSSFSQVGRLTSPRRTLNSTFGLSPSILYPTTQAIQPNSNGQKREYDKMSISPIRLDQSPRSRSNSCGLFHDESQTSKRQMLYDPDIGFVTREQREKILRENELKLRQELGRPIPTNEAEMILQVLEIGRNPNPFLKNSRHLPSIPVPTPSSTSAQRRSLVKNLNGSDALTSNLDAIYEEQALQSNPTIIAPITKKLNAERIQRLEDKKGQLRTEIKRRKMFEENLKRQSLLALGDPPEPNRSTSDQPAIDSTAQRSTRRTLRSASVETTLEAASPPRRRSTRKIGKLTSHSSKAKVNQGRKSRSLSVNDEETNEGQVAAYSSSRISDKKASVPNGSNGFAKSSNLNSSEAIHTAGKAFKSRKSPSPIQEEDEDRADQSEPQKAQITVPQHTTCLHPTVRSSSMSIQAPSSIVKSSSTSSLRPGRTFSSRRHAKARIFSALEEDLPQLNDEDEEEADQANGKLNKIKLPSTFLSSFKLDKFTLPPPPPQVNVQPPAEAQEIHDPSSASNQGSPKKSVPHASKIGLLGQSATPNTTHVAGSAATPTLGQLATNTGFPSIPNTENKVDSPNPPGPSSTFFSLSKNERDRSDNQSSSPQQSMTPFGGFSRIPSDKPPPIFFGGIASTTAATEPPSNPESQQNKSNQTTEKITSNGSFSFQSTYSSGATAIGSSSSTSLLKFGSESNNLTASPPTSSSIDTPNAVTESTETGQNKPPLFTFGTQTSSQSTTGGNEFVVTPTPTLSVLAQTNESTKISNSPAPPSLPTITFGGGSNPPAPIFGSQPASTNTGSYQMKADPAPPASSANTTSFPSSTFAFGSSQPSSATQQITNTQSDSTQSSLFGTMNSTTQPTPGVFGNSNTVTPTSNPVSSGSNEFNFNVSTKPATAPPFGATSPSSQQTPSPFAFGASTPSTSNLTMPPQSTVGSGLFGTSSPVVANGGGASSAPPISFSFSNPSPSSNTNSSPFVFGANNSSATTYNSTSSFGQPSSNTSNSTNNVFSFAAGNSSSSTPAPNTTPNQNPASNGIFGLMSGNSNNHQPSHNAFDAVSSNNSTAFKFGVTNPSFNINNNNNSGNSTTGTSLFGNSSGAAHPPTHNLFGNSDNPNTNNAGLHGLTGTNNQNGLFGASSSSFGLSSPSANNNNNSHHNMMETNSISNPVFGGGGMNTHGNLGGFGNPNNSNAMTTTNSSPFSPFGGSHLNLAGSDATQNNSQPINFGLGVPSSTTSMNGAMGGNSDLNLGIVNHNNSPIPPAPGGFVFSMGSSDNNNTNNNNGGRPIRRLPATKKSKR